MSKTFLNRTLCAVFALAAVAAAARGQNVTYKPYIQPGGIGALGASDLIVVAWQTDETKPNPGAYTVTYGTVPANGSVATVSGRVVNNYLAADPALPVPPTASGPRVNYTAVLKNLNFSTLYYYQVNGPGMPSGGFSASFQTRKTGNSFSFLVQGDEGFFPVSAGSPSHLTDFEARIINTMYNVANTPITGLTAALPKPDLALNTGDNVYNTGSEGSYRDYWFPVWNSDTASNDLGAPFIRSIPFYIVVGNHDTGGSGDYVNMLANDNGGKYTGNTGGGDALAYYNDYYFPLHGPVGVDSSYIYNGDDASQTGWYLQYKGVNYNSPAALSAYRASTAVDTGAGLTQQIDHMSNYSFDYGNAHFLFLDADPHLFNALVDYSAPSAGPPANFPDYPSILRDWVINDLDSSHQTWKFVVYHQPAFSSGYATLRNNQMRRVAKVLEDHGVNMVFNGHEHNYQRTYPLRALARVAAVPSTAGEPAVAVDTTFDGRANTTPDGVIYVVDGAGGNRDFDGNEPSPRGQGTGLDEEDSATGTSNGFPQGPAAWLDNYLTVPPMAAFVPNAGQGQKITQSFKAKLFSFSDLVVNNNSLTLYQISEPLQATSSATSSNPAPYGRNYQGAPFPDPLPETQLDPATGAVVQSAGTGTPALMDQFTVTKPDISQSLDIAVDAPASIVPGALINYSVRLTNRSAYDLNGVQLDLGLPMGAYTEGGLGPRTTLQPPNNLVTTIGRLVRGETRTVQLSARSNDAAAGGSQFGTAITVRSATALPVTIAPVQTLVAAPCATTAAPIVAAVTNGAYSANIKSGDVLVVWGSNLAANGGNTLFFQRPGFNDVWLYEGDGDYYWDLSTNQLNAALGGKLAPGAWAMTVRSSCSGDPSAPFTLNVQ